ncbi:MFS transporter [Paracraurococcus lichenis]|uniref:MFS transporter n=1 Tax=Paracraurococcus lichenis TaxID=3064888 RepID=A0ABT9DVR7_9PROT|nr:MFS transporter [Paracraurococcus sp. LOR1-02]MDO9707987.1 MFS transporter [Paracraurococcus sp. LOR1-02]
MSDALILDGITNVPARLDRLKWDDWHTRAVTALGISWALDGLQVTLFASLSGAIHESAKNGFLALSETQIGSAASVYLVGAICGALSFGWLADRMGRKRLFFVTLSIYMLASVASGCAWNFYSFVFFRALTGAGIGGEYAAINSAIQELAPADRRGRTDLAVNGTFWGGAFIGAIMSLVVLDPALIPPEIGWRLAFVISGLLSLTVIWLRHHLTESPRWLIVRGRLEEAESILEEIERAVQSRRGALPPLGYGPMALRLRGHVGIFEIGAVLMDCYRDRAVLGLVLMACQAFFYNAVFFTYSLMLMRIFHVEARHVGWYILPLAFGNLAGPLLLGRFFDTIGRRPMIIATYGIAGVMMMVTSLAFGEGWFSAWTLTAVWSLIFFFASAAASAAYLTVGESFPLEMRATAIALFYAAGTFIGGVIGPPLFGRIIQVGRSEDLMWGYLVSAALMLIAAATEWRLGFVAEKKPLEHVAPPLSSVPSDHCNMRIPGKIRLRKGEGRPFVFVLLVATAGGWLANWSGSLSESVGVTCGAALGALLARCPRPNFSRD